MRNFHESKGLRIIVVGIALIAPFALFSSKLLPYMGVNSPSLYIQELIYPVEYAWNGLYTGVTVNWQRLLDLNSSSTENIELRKEINLLKLQQINFDELRKENDELRRLLSFQEKSKEPALAVEIFGTNRKDPFQTVRINKGSTHSIETGMPVVTSAGVLGKVIRVGLTHSDVLILTDANFHLDVLIQRTRTRAIMQGTGDGACKLKIQHRSQVKIGDTVVSSGIVGAFPKGLPVGRISKISYGKDYVSQSIEIEPWVKPYNQEYALVIRRRDEDIERIVESTSKKWLENTTSISKQQSGG